MFNPFSSSFEQLQLKLLTVVLRFFPLYRFQGSVLSSELVYNITIDTSCQHLFFVFLKLFLVCQKPLYHQGLSCAYWFYQVTGGQNAANVFQKHPQ